MKYTVSAVGQNDATVSSEEKSYTVIEKVAMKFKLNEVNGNAGYIEIYNDASAEMDLKDCVIRVGTTSADDVTITNTYKIAAKGYGIVTCTGYSGTVTGAPAINKTIAANAALTIKLFAPAEQGSEAELLDTFETTNTTANADASYSRVPDVEGAWYYAEPTEGAANGISTGVIGVSPELVINEINPNGSKMVELYNSSEAEIFLENYTLEKDGAEVWKGKATSKIASGSYLVIAFGKSAPAEGELGEYETTSGVSDKKSVSIVLKDASGKEIDAFMRGKKGAAWGGQDLPEDKTHSFSRVGAGWRYADPTPGAANGTATGTIANVPAASN